MKTVITLTILLLVFTAYAGNPPPLPPLPPGAMQPSTGQSFRQFSSESLSSPPGNFDNSGDSGLNNTPAISLPLFDTNGLWLEITGVATNGLACFNLHNATNQVYALQTTTNLPNGWNVELALWPTNALVMPFTLPTLNRSNLFVRAQDWTGVTENGNLTPDWWFFNYFGAAAFTNGALALSDTNLDSQGNPLLYDFQNGLDPNVIAFQPTVTNTFLNTTTTSVAVSVAQGTPFFFAVLVNDTNFADANWLPFTGTNLPVALGTTDGAYRVRVGLRGLSANEQPVWDTDGLLLTLDRVPPLLVVTNPANSTVIKPYLQLQGYANKELSSLSYDITNALGSASNQNACVTGKWFDTNQFDFTTNYFQAYDVPLTNGVNNLTVRVTDRAGNTTITNFDVTLDYTTATNPPAVSLIWPQDGMAVSGTNITIQGTMSDETGTITAQIVDEDGNTNAVTGLVERNGMFWLENVPLNGVSQISIQATDAAGNVTMTNFTLLPSTLVLTIDATPTGDGLWQSFGSVSGTVSDPGAMVTVNGVTGTNNGDGTWSADNVPIYGMGTVTFNATATLPEEDSMANVLGTAMANLSGVWMANLPSAAAVSAPSLPAANTATNVEAASYWTITEYHETTTFTASTPAYFVWQEDYTATPQLGADGQWHNNYQGSFSSKTQGYENIEYDGTWSNTGQSDVFTDFNTGISITNVSGPFAPGTAPPIPDEDLLASPSYIGPSYLTHYSANFVSYQYFTNDTQSTLNLNAKTKVTLFTGGKSGTGRQSLFGIRCEAKQYGRPPNGYAPFDWTFTPVTDISPDTLTVLGKHPGNDGILWVALAENSVQTITVTAPFPHYNAAATPTKYKSYFTVYVAQPDPDGYENKVGEYYGHAWWEFSTEAPSDAVSTLISTNLQKYINRTAGYYPVGSVNFFGSGPGILKVPDDSHIANVEHSYLIGFPDLIKGLTFTKKLEDSPGTYNAVVNSCVLETDSAGLEVGIVVPICLYPEELGNRFRGR